MKVSLRLSAALLPALLPLMPGVPAYLFSLGNEITLAAIVAVGIVVLTGIAGMTSFMQASFMGVGAYTSAVLTTMFSVSPWLALPAALALSAVAALAIGAVTVRLSGHYLALGTLAWSVSLFYLAGNLDILGRNDGISGIPPISIGGIALSDGRHFFPLAWICLCLALILTANLLDSRIGRALRALRGGGLAAQSVGVRTGSARLLAFVHAAVLAGLAGWLFAFLQRAVNPTPFGVTASIEYLLMAVLGGVMALSGAVLGAATVTLVNDRLQSLLPMLFANAGGSETIVFGIALVLILQAAPTGIWPYLMRRPARRRRIDKAAPLPPRPMPTAGARVLAVDRLRKRFGGLVAVGGVSFEVAAAEIVALIGPNGAGKSTTFDLLTGLSQPTSGDIRFGARTVVGAAPPVIAALGIARSFQHVKLVAAMSVLENAALGAHLRGRAGALSAMLRLDRAEETRLLAEAARQLARVGLAAEANSPARSLALGQQRILEIARALCLDPVLLLLDEPAAGLRHAEKQALAGLLRQLREDGVAILLVEHDMNFVMGLADRLVVLDFGEKLAEGAPELVRNDPAVIEAYLGGIA